MNTKYLIPAASLVILLGATSGAVLAETTAKPKSADTATAIGDAAITTKIKARYLGDARLKDSDISVTTANGVVSLTGKAASSESKSAAEELARQVDGVRNVDNLIETPSLAGSISGDIKSAAKKTEQASSDSWITTKVKSSLLADGTTKGLNINVKTVNHVVILSGTAGSQAEADKAVEIARSIKGVENVESSSLKIVSKS
ncbi:MAG: BON domain-containing protein [Moraxellaceae bacterium]